MTESGFPIGPQPEIPPAARPPMAPPPPPIMPPVMPPPRKKSLLWLWILLGVGGLGLFMLIGLAVMVGAISAMFSGPSDYGAMMSKGDGVAIIRINGEIASGGDGGPFGDGVAGSDTIIQQIKKAAENKRARAILVRINSPGGSAAASEEIYRELMALRKDKPIVISMGDVAASGGYYIASAGHQIYCNAGTLTGSIGVISAHMDLSKLMQKIGAGFDVTKSGEFKDMGIPSRPSTAREKALMQNLIMDVYDQFVTAVADGRSTEGRKMTKEQVKKLADGRIYTGRQALKVGLVDEIGGFQQAFDKAAKMGHISGKARRIEYGPRNLFEALFGRADVDAALSSLAKQMLMREAAKELSKSTLQ